MKQLGFFVIDRLETGKRIWGYRKKMHLSQEGLAGLLAGKGVEVSTNSIGRWERGEVDISYEYANALSEIFGCPLYGGLVVYHLRGSEDERDQPVFHIIAARTHIRDMRPFLLPKFTNKCFFWKIPTGGVWFILGFDGILYSQSGGNCMECFVPHFRRSQIFRCGRSWATALKEAFMMSKKTALPMKGFHKNRFFLWTLGLIHGKIIRTGCLDPESNTISSGYVTRQVENFHSACVARRDRAEQKLSEQWRDADLLRLEYAEETEVLARTGGGRNAPADADASLLRAEEKAAGAYASHVAKRQNILRELSRIANEIRSEQNTAQAEMEATAEVLLSAFASYGHGMLMKPIHRHNLPAISYENHARRIVDNHEDTWNAIEAILKEVMR